MKGTRPQTAVERQRSYRENLALKSGKRLSITINQEATDALEVIRKYLAAHEIRHTKRAAIETALILYAKVIKAPAD